MAALLELPGRCDAPAIEAETAGDAAAREALLDRVMGPSRRTKSSESLRRGHVPAEGLAFVARDSRGTLVGTVRLWNIAAGIDADCRPVPALLLGPLAVDLSCKGAGIGSEMMRRAIDEARGRGHGAILLVGDAPYYRRFGFSTSGTGSLTMPGPFERGRFLALELIEGALAGAVGMLQPTGRRSADDQAALAA